MTYISATSFGRLRAFDACVGQLEQDLKTDAVRDALGEQATREFLDITSRLELASVRDGIISMGRRAIRDGKIALAFLTDNEAHAFHIAPSLQLSMLPEQKRYYDELPIHPVDKIIKPAATNLISTIITQRDTLKPLDCGGEFFFACGDLLGSTIGLNMPMRTSYDTRREYNVNYRPSIVMQISDYWRFPRFNADTLLHEERHVLQACQAPLLLPKTLQSQEDFHSQVIFRHEVEAYHQETLYQKAVGIPPTSWLDELRTELEIPVIGPDEPFDIYQPLVDGLDEEGTVRLHADRAAHDIDMCCIRSLIKVRAPWLTRAFSRPQA